MMDLHSHILPGQDDGAQSLEQSLSMARMAVDSGVSVMAATPHCTEEADMQTRAVWEMLAEALQENGIPLRLCPGMEIFGTPDTARLLREGRLLTLNDSRYPLIEFSFHTDGSLETRILKSVIRAGYRPVVAHPERYRCIQRDPGLANAWKRMGCLFQINRGSLLGRFGEAARTVAFELVGHGFASAVASDAHSSRIRTPWMRDVAELLSWEFSEEVARLLLREAPGAILNNEELPPDHPVWF